MELATIEVTIESKAEEWYCILMPKQFSISAYGHSNIRSQHKTTWQLTKEEHVTPQGDCIIGVGASAATSDLPIWLQEHLNRGGKIKTIIRVGDEEIQGTAEGDPNLTFADEVDMVFRKSHFICDRTIAINSSLVAKDLPPQMIDLLKTGATLDLTIVKID